MPYLLVFQKKVNDSVDENSSCLFSSAEKIDKGGHIRVAPKIGDSEPHEKQQNQNTHPEINPKARAPLAKFTVTSYHFPINQQVEHNMKRLNHLLKPKPPTTKAGLQRPFIIITPRETAMFNGRIITSYRWVWEFLRNFVM